MKTTMKIFTLLVILIFSGRITHASGTPEIDMQAMEGTNARLQIESDENKKLEITIRNKSGQVVYYKETAGESDKYLHIYDFSEYKPGVYDLIVSCDNVLTEQQFTIANDIVSVGEKQMTLKPLFAFNSQDQVLQVAYLNFPDEKVKLKVYNGNELIYQKALDNSFSVKEGLDLSKLQTGNYQVVLAAGSKKFEYPVDIR